MSVSSAPFDGQPFEVLVWSEGGRYLAGYCQLSCPTDTRGRFTSAPLFLIDRRSGRLDSTPMAKEPNGTGSLAQFTPDDEYVMVALDGAHQRLVRLRDKKVLRETTMLAVYDSHAFSPDGSVAAIGSAIGGFTLLGLPKGDQIVREQMDNPFGTSAAMHFTWPGQGARLLVTWQDIELFDPRTGKKLGRADGFGGSSRMESIPHEKGALIASCRGVVKRVTLEPFAVEDVGGFTRSSDQCSLYATPDGRRVYRGDERGVELFDVDTRATTTLSTLPCWDLAPSRDGKRLAVSGRRQNGDKDEQVTFVYDIGTKAPPLVIEGADHLIGWSAEGDLYLNAEPIVRVWSAAARAVTHELELPWSTNWRQLALSPDGRFLGGTDGHPFVVRTSDKTVLRLGLEKKGRAGSLSPSAAEIAAFFSGAAAKGPGH